MNVNAKLDSIQPIFLGVDGCRGGWVAVALNASGFVDAGYFASFAELMRAHAGALSVGVDMPLGLLSAGRREADAAARAWLRGQSSSVFAAPTRPVLAEREYTAANERSRRRDGRGLSKQSFHLFEKIREVDEFVADRRLHEVHPEISFRLMKGGVLPHRKKTFGGMRERWSLLETNGVVLPGDHPALAPIGIDDVLDAAAVAWSARRIASGAARSFPETTEQRDRSGRAIVIRA